MNQKTEQNAPPFAIVVGGTVRKLAAARKSHLCRNGGLPRSDVNLAATLSRLGCALVSADEPGEPN